LPYQLSAPSQVFEGFILYSEAFFPEEKEAETGEGKRGRERSAAAVVSTLNP
jgi:hypothetical protein